MRYAASIDPLDQPTFDALVRREAAGALRLATVVLGTRDGADDVVQVAMERAWSSFATYDVDRPFRPWFLRIVANTARNDRRQRGRRAQLRLRAERERDRQQPSAEDDAMTVLDRTHVLAAMNGLDADDRTVIALRYFEQLGEAEMAEVLACAPGTVKSRLSRARQRLRQHLEAVPDG
ncbi:MAG: sigma-70 family RNA polymerase sigma factor [Ilumatobacteraceae bacterium]